MPHLRSAYEIRVQGMFATTLHGMRDETCNACRVIQAESESFKPPSHRFFNSCIASAVGLRFLWL